MPLAHFPCARHPNRPSPAPMAPPMTAPTPGDIRVPIAADCRCANQLPSGTVAPKNSRCAHAAADPGNRARDINFLAHEKVEAQWSGWARAPFNGPKGPNPKRFRSGRRNQLCGMSAPTAAPRRIPSKQGCCSARSPASAARTQNAQGEARMADAYR